MASKTHPGALTVAFAAARNQFSSLIERSVGNRTRRRLPTLRSIRLENWLRAAAKATVRAPGWVFDAIADSVALRTEKALARRRDEGEKKKIIEGLRSDYRVLR